MSTRTPMVCVDCNTAPRAVVLDQNGKIMVACDCYQVHINEVGMVERWSLSIDSVGDSDG